MMKKFYIKWVLLIVALFYGPLALAAETSFSFKDYFTPVKSDISVQYLMALFGNVGNVLGVKGSGSLLGDMFGVFNHAVLVLGAVVILYTIFVNGIINSAHQGEFLGKNKDSLWIPIRSVAGFALLVPSATTGYSLIQVFMMWVIVQGIGAADHLWKTTVNDIVKFGLSGSAPSVAEAADNFGAMKETLKGLVCMQGVAKKNMSTIAAASGKKAANITQDDLMPKGHYVLSNADMSSGIALGSTTFWKGMVVHPGYQGSMYYESDIKHGGTVYIEGYFFYPKILSMNVPPFGSEGTPLQDALHAFATCGSMWYLRNSPLADSLQNKRLQGFYMGMRKIVPELNSLAYDYWANGKFPETGVNPITAASGEVSQSIVDYLNTQKVTEPAWEKDTLSQGWMGAGAYYYNIVQQKGSIEGMGNFSNFIFYPGENGSPWNEVGEYAKVNTNSVKYVNEVWQDALSDANLVPPNVPGQGGIKAGAKTLAGNAFAGFMQAVTGQRQDFEHAKMTSPLQAITSFEVDPLIALHRLGRNYIAAAWTTVLVTFAVIADVSMVANVVRAYSPLGPTFQIMIKYLAIPVFSVAAALISLGVVFAVYIPLIPFIQFLFAVIGWLIAVVETMLAAPLVALGITHPEGHEVYGRAEPAIQLLTNVFLRPTFIIFGFIIAILILRISLHFLNFFYGYVLTTIPIGWAVESIAAIVVYVLIVIAVINRCFSLMHLIPDRVLAWIGNQTQFGQYAGGQEQVEAGLKSAGGMMGGVTSSVGGQTLGGTAAYQEAMDSRLEREKGRSVSGKGGKSGGGTSDEEKSRQLGAAVSTPAGAAAMKKVADAAKAKKGSGGA